MGVPEYIRKVSRPVNTIVVDNGRDGPNRWAVRERAFVRYVPGKKNPQPHSGKTIGHIIDGKFVPISQPAPDVSAPVCLQYGAAAFVRTVVKDIQDDLLQVFPPRTAFSILAIATLRALEPGVPDRRLQYFYRRSFVSLHYPGVFLSPPTVHRLCEELGTSPELCTAFARRRLERVPADHHILVDALLRPGGAAPSGLSAYAGKPPESGTQAEVSVLHAVDLEEGELLCGEVFSGRPPDFAACASFLGRIRLTRGLLVDTPPDPVILQSSPQLHFLAAAARNDGRIAAYHLTEPEGVLAGCSSTLFFRKAQTAPGQYLYAFLDPRQACEELSRFASGSAAGGRFDSGAFAAERNTCGLTVLESDADLPPETVWQSWTGRWKTGMVLRAMFSPVPEEAGAPEDPAAIGSDFIRMIAATITLRLLKKLEQTDLFATCTYHDVFVHLKAAWRQADAPEPVTGDRWWSHTSREDAEVLERLGLAAPDPSRKPERPGGRSRKSTQPDGHAAPRQEGHAKGSADTAPEEKRRPGRPRIHPPKDPDAPKRPRGRPRVHPPKDPDAPKRPRGRPRKDTRNPEPQGGTAPPENGRNLHDHHDVL